MAEGAALTQMFSNDRMSEIREAFFEVADGKDTITADKLGDVMKLCGENVPAFKLRQQSEELQKETGGEIDFNRFLKLFRELSVKVVGGEYKKVVDKKVGVEERGGGSSASAEGTRHSFSNDETVAFTDWINCCLEDDPELQGKYLPIDEESADGLFKAVKDGVLLCKMINFSVPETIDERAINKTKLNMYTIHENQTLVLNSAMAIGCNIVNIGAEDIIQGKPHLVLGLLWQVIRIGLFAKISIQNCPGLVRLLEDYETLDDLKSLPPEEVLLRWFNYHLEQAGHHRRVKNFSSDINDAENYSILLKRIAPPELSLDEPHVKESDPTKLATLVLENATKMNCRKFVRPKDIVKGNAKLNLAFVCNLFNMYPCLEPVEDIEQEVEETREDKTFRNWMNSLGVKPYVHNLYADVEDGLILLQLFDVVKPGTVDWDDKTVNKPPFKKLKAKLQKIENCNYVIKVAGQLKFSVVGIGGTDIHEGKKKLVMALLWQIMRAYTLTVLQKCTQTENPVTELELVDWVNNKLSSSGKTSKISGFKDSDIKTSWPVIDLIDAIKPGVINYSLLSRDENDDEAMFMNAKYAISMARKIGARVYALPEDLKEGKSKMVLTVFACLMACGLLNSK